MRRTWFLSAPLATRARKVRLALVTALASRPLATAPLARESLRLGPPRPPSPRCASPRLVTALLACESHRPLLGRLGPAPLGLLVSETRKPLWFSEHL